MHTVKKIAVLILLVMFLPFHIVVAAEQTSDVRVIIDVSGSMKQNDPDNLRTPALKLLVGLMPEDAEAGVWTFAKLVNMLVPWQKVDEQWRNLSTERSKQIHSLGLFTDIEQALLKATSRQIGSDKNKRQSVILLSDGFIDLQAGKKASQQSRQRLLNKIIPKLKAAEVAVHTIALSENADHELLEAMSLATDGWYQQAKSADELQRIFLQMFEKATQPETVPLVENNFKIDGSVTEMTVLVFRQADSAATRLKQPDGQYVTQADISEQLRWLHENTFDLITIENPALGEWSILAEIDPDNRVMVITDMKLTTTELPNNILKGEKLDFEVALTEKGEVIQREAFLNLVDLSLKHKLAADEVIVELASVPEEGIFKTQLGEAFAVGQQDVTVTVKSATFERQKKQSIRVIAAPFYIDHQQLDTEIRSHRLDVEVEPSLIVPDSVVVKALLKDEEGSEWPYNMTKSADNHWQLTLTDLIPETIYNLTVQLRGETPEARPVFLVSDAIELADLPPMLSLEEELAPLNEPIMPGEADTLFVDESADFTDEMTEEDLIVDNGFVISDTTKLLIGNGVIVLLLIIGVLWWRKQNVATLSAGEMLS